eukprot:365228-Chlamydomonas_euryale.AAC.5
MLFQGGVPITSKRMSSSLRVPAAKEGGRRKSSSPCRKKVACGKFLRSQDQLNRRCLRGSTEAGSLRTGAVSCAVVRSNGVRPVSRRPLYDGCRLQAPTPPSPLLSPPQRSVRLTFAPGQSWLIHVVLPGSRRAHQRILRKRKHWRHLQCRHGRVAQRRLPLQQLAKHAAHTPHIERAAVLAAGHDDLQVARRVA